MSVILNLKSHDEPVVVRHIDNLQTAFVVVESFRVLYSIGIVSELILNMVFLSTSGRVVLVVSPLLRSQDTLMGVPKMTLGVVISGGR